MLTIALLSVVLIGVAIWLARTYWAPGPVPSFSRIPTLEELQPIATEPDGPEPFGYKSGWFAIRTEDPRAVVKALGLRPRVAANWSAGLTAAYQGWIFVTPPIDGWVLAVSRDLPDLHPHTPSDPAADSLLAELATHFEEVQYFATHRVVDYHTWYRFQNGVCVRAYAYLGESGETLINFGENSPEEEELGFEFVDDPAELDADDWRTSPPPVPGEEELMMLAAEWSVSPVDLVEGGQGRGTGILGLLPE